MTLPERAEPADMRAFWNGRARELLRSPVDASVHAGTVTRDEHVASLRDRLELAHLEQLWSLRPTTRVLDLAGGAGRIALRIAPRVAHVTVVDIAEEQLAVARRTARARGIDNLSVIHASLAELELSGRFDVILMLGVLLYLDDDGVRRVAQRCARWLVAGGTLIMKEPVSTTGMDIVQESQAAGAEYRALFRPREYYAQVFGRELRPRYQGPTIAHPIPFFVRGTDGAVAATRSAWTRRATAALAPVYVRLDPALRRLEAHLRGHPQLARLLAPIDVLQDFYVFEKQEEHSVDLSVVVIAYNEAECLEEVAEELRSQLGRAGMGFEIVLVDDGSRDDTLAIMRRLAERSPVFRVVPLSPNRGIGGALRAGFDAARGAFVTWVPADGQIPPDAVTTLYARRREAPLLTTVYRSRDDAWFRVLISRSLNTMIALKTGQVAKSGGNYLFAREAWQAHGPRDDDTMMLSTAFRHNLRAAGLSIGEVEIDCRARVAGHSKVLNPRAIARTLFQLLRMR